MANIYIRSLDDDENGYWVTSDDDPIGTESHFTDQISNENERIMIALAEFLGYEPVELLNFDYCISQRIDYCIQAAKNDLI